MNMSCHWLALANPPPRRDPAQSRRHIRAFHVPGHILHNIRASWSSSDRIGEYACAGAFAYREVVKRMLGTGISMHDMLSNMPAMQPQAYSIILKPSVWV